MAEQKKTITNPQDKPYNGEDDEENKTNSDGEEDEEFDSEPTSDYMQDIDFNAFDDDKDLMDLHGEIGGTRTPYGATPYGRRQRDSDNEQTPA